MATTPDLHAGGSGFKSRCRPTNFGAHLPHTPPPGRKDVSRVPKGMVYAKAKHPGWPKKIISFSDLRGVPHVLQLLLLLLFTGDDGLRPRVRVPLRGGGGVERGVRVGPGLRQGLHRPARHHRLLLRGHGRGGRLRVAVGQVRFDTYKHFFRNICFLFFQGNVLIFLSVEHNSFFPNKKCWTSLSLIQLYATFVLKNCH